MVSPDGQLGPAAEPYCSTPGSCHVCHRWPEWPHLVASLDLLQNLIVAHLAHVMYVTGGQIGLT